MGEIIDDISLLTQFKEPATREKAFTYIVKKYQEKIYWHIRRMVVEHDDANDVVQLTFIKAWKGLDNFRGESQLYTWLYRIASNESLTFLKQKKNRNQHLISDDTTDLTEQIKATEGFDANKLEWKLQLAIQSLPDKQRTVFLLRYYDEMPYGEMSKVLDISEGSLKANYHHAAKKIESFILEN